VAETRNPIGPGRVGCSVTHAGSHGRRSAAPDVHHEGLGDAASLGHSPGVRFWLLCVLLAVAVVGCAPATQVKLECVDVDAELCDAAWQLAQPHLLPEETALREVFINRAGGAATCHPAPCPELIAATAYYDAGVLQEVILQVDGGLRVVDARRVVRVNPPADGGKPEQAPEGVEAIRRPGRNVR
jgi:hypothetical protein